MRDRGRYTGLQGRTRKVELDEEIGHESEYYTEPFPPHLETEDAVRRPPTSEAEESDIVDNPTRLPFGNIEGFEEQLERVRRERERA